MPVVEAAGGLLLAAVVGTAVTELLAAIKKVRRNISSCKEEMDQLAWTLNSIIPLYVEGLRLEAVVMGSDRVRPDQLLMIQQLQEGTALVRKRDTIRPWSYRKKHIYAQQVRKLNSFLTLYCQRVITMEIFLEGKRNRARDKQLCWKCSQALLFTPTRFAHASTLLQHSF